jgi:hypothetical protein
LRVTLARVFLSAQRLKPVKSGKKSVHKKAISPCTYNIVGINMGLIGLVGNFLVTFEYNWIHE